MTINKATEDAPSIEDAPPIQEDMVWWRFWEPVSLGDEGGTRRLEAFSDGVFAIAITLLVLDVHVPLARDLSQGVSLGHALVQQGAEYFSYIISFILIGIIWASHSKAFSSYIAASDAVLLFLNTVFLMCIAFIPFSTHLLAEYLQHGGGDNLRTAVLVYSGILALNGLLWCVLWSYARLTGLLRAEIPAALVQRLTVGYFVGPALYVLSFALAFRSLQASLALYVLVIVLYIGGSVRGGF